jgi:hypothetical protein
MNTTEKTITNKKTTELEDVKINVKIKLSALWAALIFLYTYGDILGFYTPGNLEQLISGEIEGIQLSEGVLIVNAITMAIQSVMIFLSVALKANANRWANLILGVFAAVVLVVATYVGGIDVRYAIQASVELVLIALIIWHAWKWPKLDRVEDTP